MSSNNHKQKFQEIERKFANDQGLPFEDVLPEAEIRKEIEEKNIQYRHRTLTPFIVIWAFLSQIFTGACCKKVAKNIEAFFQAKGIRKKVTESAYCQARKNLPTPLLSSLALNIAEKEKNTVDALWCGRNVKIADGSTVNMADTPKNQQAYPQSESQRPGCGFPIARIMVLFCLATGMIVNMYMAPLLWSEQRLLMIHLNQLIRGDILLGDRGFCSYVMIAMLLMHHIDSVFRMNATRKVNFARGRAVDFEEHIVSWKKPTARSPLLTEEEWELLPETLEIREVYYRVEIPGFRCQEVILATTLLDCERYTKWDLADLYRLRWKAELYLRNAKITMKMEFINSKTPKMVKNQIWVHVLAYNLIRSLMCQAGEVYSVSPLLISFKGTIDSLNVYLPRLSCASIQRIRLLYQNFLFAIVQDVLPKRKPRYQPRLIKRRKKPSYNYLFRPRSFYRQRVGL
jgi:hypothetical protein